MAGITSIIYYHNIETSNFPKLLLGTVFLNLPLFWFLTYLQCLESSINIIIDQFQLFMCNCHMGQQDGGFLPSIRVQNGWRNHHPLDLRGLSAPFSLTMMSLRSINYDLIHDHFAPNTNPFTSSITYNCDHAASFYPSPMHYHFLLSQLGELTPPFPFTKPPPGFKVSILQSLSPEGRDQILSLSLQTQLSWHFNVHYWAAKAVGVS